MTTEQQTLTDDINRDNYRLLADALLTMTRLDSQYQPALLDVESTAEGKDHVLIAAIHEHLFFVFESIDFYAKDGMDMYVELRLLADRQRARRGREYAEAPSKKEAVDA